MARTFKTWRDPYDQGYSTCKPRSITIEEGVTVLVGCNGAGKSTLLHNIEEECKENKVPVIHYDDEKTDNRELALMRGNMTLFGALMMSSEGEKIKVNLGCMLSDVRHFIITGLTKEEKDRLKWEAFEGKNQSAVLDSCDDRFLLFDAIDSGASIDNVLELKEIFKLILEDSQAAGVHTYIIVSANEYELASGEQCFDVNKGKYITFKDYDDYKEFIIKSRKLKDSIIEKAAQKREGKKNGEKTGRIS